MVFLLRRFFGGAVFRRAFLRGACFLRSIRLGLIVFLVFRGVATTGRSSRTLLRVVGDIPAGALELDGGSGNGLLDLSAAFGALLDHLVGKFLNFFEAVAALLTFVFVKGHECETVVRDNSVSY